MVTTAPNRERKTTIIIGASRGLGLGLAREFARRGWQVTATARNASSAKELAATFAASDEKIAVEQVCLIALPRWPRVWRSVASILSLSMRALPVLSINPWTPSRQRRSAR
jgi:NAD(P)-dependent dehydrogenase (short-subunit alcohol dehydrogenase family)